MTIGLALAGCARIDTGEVGLRVGIDKIDLLMNMVGELVLARNQTLQFGVGHSLRHDCDAARRIAKLGQRIGARAVVETVKVLCAARPELVVLDTVGALVTVIFGAVT